MSFSRTRHYNYKQVPRASTCLPRPSRGNNLRVSHLHTHPAVCPVVPLFTSPLRSPPRPSSRSCGSGQISPVQTLHDSCHLRESGYCPAATTPNMEDDHSREFPVVCCGKSRRGTRRRLGLKSLERPSTDGQPFENRDRHGSMNTFNSSDVRRKRFNRKSRSADVPSLVRVRRHVGQ